MPTSQLRQYVLLNLTRGEIVECADIHRTVYNKRMAMRQYGNATDHLVIALRETVDEFLRQARS